ncbi:MAG: peptide chain release factor N(5)-glutamine methyltransferase [Pseudomonadota bacterium]
MMKTEAQAEARAEARTDWRSALTGARNALARAGVPDPSGDARQLFDAATGTNAKDRLLKAVDFNSDTLSRFENMVAARAERVPVSRIIGTRGFWSLDLEVTGDTLDPRADTETLVELAVRLIDKHEAPLRIADFGTGTGCLGLALLSVFPLARVVAVDRSAAATATARRNARRTGYADRFSVVTGDWGRALAGPFDLIVSNPPYIATGEAADLMPEVSRYDPALALYAGEDGLDAYRELAHQLGELLVPEGIAILEIGAGMEAAVRRVITGEEGRGGLRFVDRARDLGGHTRALAFTTSG